MSSYLQKYVNLILSINVYIFVNSYVSTNKGEPTPERGDRSKVYYRLTREGVKVLREIRRINSLIWNGIEELKFEEE